MANGYGYAMLMIMVSIDVGLSFMATASDPVHVCRYSIEALVFALAAQPIPHKLQLHRLIFIDN